jgi:hypothetical protein
MCLAERYPVTSWPAVSALVGVDELNSRRTPVIYGLERISLDRVFRSCLEWLMHCRHCR